jgi:hypothetical protein
MVDRKMESRKARKKKGSQKDRKIGDRMNKKEDRT